MSCEEVITVYIVLYLNHNCLCFPCSHVINIEKSCQHEALTDLGDVTPLTLPPTLFYMYMDWKNSGWCKPFVLIESRFSWYSNL